MEKRTMYSEGSSNASISLIPLDLWLQIFGSFPVKTLLVLRAVSKSFLSVIDDPYFVSLHRDRFPENALETRFLVYQGLSNGLVFRVHEIHNLYTPRTRRNFKTIAPDGVEKPAIKPSSRWNVVCSLDGLVLLSTTRQYARTRTRTSVALWNPSIRKHCLLDPPSPEARNFGLGCDPLSKDYKVVALHEFRDQAWVYSVKTKSWTQVLDRFRRGHDTGRRQFSYSKSLFFKEGVVWMEIASYFVAPYGCRLVWFDFETERFHYVDEMPSSAILKLVMLDGGSTIGVWCTDDKHHVSVWALESDDKSWTLRYKLAPPPEMWDSSGFHLRFADRSRLDEKNGELVWKCWTGSGETFKVLTFKIDVETQVYRIKATRIVRECLDLYVESLVMAS